jgi:hypothetical protein
MKRLRGAALTLLGALLAACSSNPMTGRSQFSLMPENTVISPVGQRLQGRTGAVCEEEQAER